MALARCSSLAYGVIATTHSAARSEASIDDDGARSASSMPPTST